MSKPEEYLSWAWTPSYIEAATQGHDVTPSGLLIPSSAGNQFSNGAIAHFSRFNSDGEEISWLWLFENQAEALRLRLLPQIAPSIAGVGLIDATLPKPPPGKTYTFCQVVPVRWFNSWPLELQGIYEIWIGFDWAKFVSTRDLSQSAHYIMGSGEFCQHLKVA